MRRFDSDRPSPSEAISSGVAHRLEIVERLAHAHHHDVGDLAALRRHDGALRRLAIGEIAEAVARDQQLREDFLGGQIAHQLLRAGVAEGAGQRAADLAGDARACRGLPRECRRSRSRPAGRRRAAESGSAICGCRLPTSARRRSSGRAMVNCCVELGAQVLGDVGHLRKVGDAAHIEPVPELGCTHAGLPWRNAGLGKRVRERIARQSDQGLLRRGDGTQRIARLRFAQIDDMRHGGTKNSAGQRRRKNKQPGAACVRHTIQIALARRNFTRQFLRMRSMPVRSAYLQAVMSLSEAVTPDSE